MSMCTILPCLANSLTLPVTRSSKRTPRAKQQVGFVDRIVGVDGAVHAEHLQAEEMFAGKGAQAQERQGDRNAGTLGKRPQLRSGAGRR